MSLPELYSALADPTRLKVLEMLHEKSKPVHELAAAFDISRPAISRHLRVLKEAGLVREVKQGRENVYSFQRDKLRLGTSWLKKHSTKPGVKAKPKDEVALKAKAPAIPAALTPKVVAAKPKPASGPAVPAPAASLTPQLSFFDF